MEYWLPHWKAAFTEAHAQSVMSSYNAINGTPDAVNHYLLTDILRSSGASTASSPTISARSPS